MAEQPPQAAPQVKTTVKPPAEAIKELESEGSRVLVYTSARSIGPWDIPPLYKLMAQMGHQSKLSIIIKSTGGFSDDAFKMATVIHEFANEVDFVVPFYAKSAATLLCLSGDKILMGPISELGPTNPMMSVDERIITPTLHEPKEGQNEPAEKKPRTRQMAAHALRDFLTAAGILKSDGAEYDPDVLSIYMARGILNPFLLGDFERSGKIASQYAERLLTSYMFKNRSNKDELAKNVATQLCEGYYDHAYPIGRKEARDRLLLSVEDMSDELWQQTSDLIIAYDKMMESQKIATIIETSQAFEITHYPQSP